MAMLVITRWYFMISYDQIRSENHPQLWEIQVEDPAVHPMEKSATSNICRLFGCSWILMGDVIF